MEQLSYTILSSAQIQDMLSDFHDTDDAAAHSNANRTINMALSNYYETYKNNGLSYITLYNSVFLNTTDWTRHNKADPELVETALKKAELAEGRITWTTGNLHAQSIILSRIIRKVQYLSFEEIGKLLISVDLNKLITNINYTFSQFDTYYYVLADENGAFYTSPSLPETFVQEALQTSPRDYRTFRQDGHSYFAASTMIPGYDIQYIALVPYDEIVDTLDFSVRAILILMVIGLAAGLFLTQMLIQSVIRHFNVLILKMDTFSKDEFALQEIEYDYASRRDEIGVLHQRFDRMTKRIQNLININYKNELLRKEAQIKALESQINPHFLYNTLDSINWRAKIVGDTQISQMAESLGNLLRATLSNKESLIPLKQELELVHSYSTIQKIRFEERLEFTLSSQEGLDAALIPPLSIQPLVENAIRYGMEEMTEACQIQVTVEQKEQDIIICVRNEGSSFEDHLLEKLSSKQKQPNGFGIGLVNIHRRIQLLFGPSYGLTLSNEGDWAVATISIPFTTKEN